MVIFAISGRFRPKVVVCSQKWLFSGKMMFFPQDGCIREEWLYSGKGGCNRAEAVFGQSGCIRTRWLYSDKVAVFGQKWFYSG